MLPILRLNENVEGRAGNRVNVRESVIEAARNKVRQLADEGRTVEQIDRALAGDGLTEQERDVAYLLATYEVGRGSAGSKGAPGYWADVEREIGG